MAGYIPTPRSPNPWVSEPQQPTINQRAPFPRYSTSRGNYNRQWNGDAEANIGRRLGQIAYGQSMYVNEWITPRIKEAEAKQHAHDGEGDGGGGVAGTSTGPQPPSLTGALAHGAPEAGDGFVAGPRRDPLSAPSTAAYKPGAGGRPAPWKENTSVPQTATFGKRLATQTRVQARNAQTGGPSLLGALPAPNERVGPSAKRRGPAGMDPRKRGTWNNYE